MEYTKTHNDSPDELNILIDELGKSCRWFSFSWITGEDDADDYGRDGYIRDRDLLLLVDSVRHYFRVRARALKLNTIVIPYTGHPHERAHLHAFAIDNVDADEERSRWMSHFIQFHENDGWLRNPSSVRVEYNPIRRKAFGAQHRAGRIGSIKSSQYTADEYDARHYCAWGHQQLKTLHVWNRQKPIIPLIPELSHTYALQTML